MLDLRPGNPVTIKTTRDVYRCKTVVLALGPWAPKFLPHLGLQLPLRVRLCSLTKAIFWRNV